VIVLEFLAAVLVTVGAFFFLAGTVGVLRFPDVLSRLHAVTKADNLGLGLIVAGLALRDPASLGSLKLLLIWVLVLVASATSCYVIASSTVREEPSQGEGP